MQVKIERLNDQGQGICYIDNKISFVNFTLPDEIVDVTVIKSLKKYNICQLNEIVKKSSKRKESYCRFANTCGGCHLSHLFYEETIEFKKLKLERIFYKYCHLVASIPIIESSNQLYYRNKLTLHIKNSQIGLYMPETNSIVSINKCFLVKESINNILKEISKFNIKNGQVVIRTNYNSEILLNFITDDSITIPNLSSYKIAGILQNGKIIKGDDFLIEKLNGLFFKVSYDAFFQVNLDICQKLFSLIQEFVPKNGILLDMFCGTGTLGLNVASYLKKVYGIEINENATINATYNAKINGINNAYYLCGDANKLISKIDDKIDTIIIDPPRSGMTKNGIDLLLKINAQNIIYIACDPFTLARDINLLSENYEIEKIMGLDMFCFTYHIECLSILKRKVNKQEI